jgi:hypothetical protein
MKSIIIAAAVVLGSLAPALASSHHPASRLAKGEFIDPDTGLVCHNTGFASICESPPADMTIRYTNKHVLNCTRTGAMAICSNL